MHIRRQSRPESGRDKAVSPQKLRRDVVERLETQGRLRADHLLAVRDIRRIWRAFGRGMFPSARNYGQLRVDGGKRFTDPIDTMREGEQAVYQNRYKPWADWAGRQNIPNRAGNRLSLLQLVYDMAVDNCGPRQWEDRNQVRHGTATKLLSAALDAYLDRAG